MKDSYNIDFNNRPIETEYVGIEELELIKQLNPQQRELVYTSISEYQDLRERIVNSFKTFRNSFRI